MLLQLSLLHFFLLLPLTFSSSIARENCPKKCGIVSIPFPFGVGQGCFLEPSFNIVCDNSTNPPKAYMEGQQGRMGEIIEINKTQIRVNNPYLLQEVWYNLSSNSSNLPNRADAYSEGRAVFEPYTWSEENWLIGMGCDDLVLREGSSDDLVLRTYGGGCVSYCENVQDFKGRGFCPDNVNGDSSGNGCCRTSVPYKGISYLGVRFVDLSIIEWRRKRLFPYSYAIVQEKGNSNQHEFSYPLSYLNNSAESLEFTWNTVVRLDWRITAAKNCREAQRNSANYTCQDNSDCTDFDADVGGYLCSCKRGYEGNPYLAPGCRDINECDSKTNPCGSNSICTNTRGSFRCSCRKGYYSGDGTKSGRGCIQQPRSKISNVLIGVGCGLGFVLLLLICFWLHKVCQKRKHKVRKEKFFKRNGGLLLLQKTNEGTLGKTKLFPAKELETATDHFNESRILGQGGQGTVYKGMLTDGKIVAVKKSRLVDKDQLETFINEVVILSQINHRNVVKLLGCCLETEVPLLVYEFLPNGNLFDLIHDSDTKFLASWNKRLKIAADIAGALAYLHSASSIPIYHRDIKSQNILLDEKYIVKMADFGTSRSVEADQTHLTTKVKGTFGYFDPEYFQSGHFTDKSDVYSFGVVLVEILTRQKPISLKRIEDERSLVTWFLASMEENNLDVILDPKVLEHDRKDQVIVVARLAQRCLNSMGKMRPTMKEVATELESLRISEMPLTVTDESQEAIAYEAKPIMISDIEYTWPTSGDNVPSSSSDIHPLMFGTT